MLAIPRPSRSISTSTWVSLVMRLIRLLRMPSPELEGAVLSGAARIRHSRTRIDQIAPARRNAYIISQAWDARMQASLPEPWHGTTILTVRKNGSVVIGGDGQVSIGQTVVKANAKKVRRLGKGEGIGGGFGGTAPPLSLFLRGGGKKPQKNPPHPPPRGGGGRGT